MTAALRQVSDEYSFGTTEAVDSDCFLEHLRQVSRVNRCKSYIDMFGACAALSGNNHVATQAASEVLVRCLSQALGRRPVLLRRGERETSFDEDWLIAVARSLKTGDDASTTFLLNSRVPKHARRNLIFLLRHLVDNFSRI
ncbi:hypothetical protein [Roseovarius sp. MMSF_3281]|uniref:hypothetical protein n=1 Tax=Roseovarius sp. MMSF_3281 TaxID=3046694 RepID=UPI00273E18F5|nr:hypothetical protein [Roseovarius sp. MMSF_3281]